MMLLLPAASVAGMGLWCRRPGCGSCGSRLGLCGVFRVRFCLSVFVARCASRCRVRLGGFLLFFFLFWWFLDSAQLAENFLALLRSFPAPGELHRKNLFDNLVKLRASRHSQRLQLIPHLREGVADRPPLVQVRANFGERAALVRFR